MADAIRFSDRRGNCIDTTQSMLAYDPDKQPNAFTLESIIIPMAIRELAGMAPWATVNFPPAGRKKLNR